MMLSENCWKCSPILPGFTTSPAAKLDRQDQWLRRRSRYGRRFQIALKCDSALAVTNSFMPSALTVSGGSLQNYLRTPEELMRRANDVIAKIRGAAG